MFPCIFFSSYGQELTQLKDTSLYLVQLHSPEFVFEYNLRYSLLPAENIRLFPGKFYHASSSSPQPLMWEFQNKIDIASPWKLQLARENENRTLNTIFGSIGTGGALYMAYRHVKKYGFWGK